MFKFPNLKNNLFGNIFAVISHSCGHAVIVRMRQKALVILFFEKNGRDMWGNKPHKPYP